MNRSNMENPFANLIPKTWHLSQKDMDYFLEVLANPPKPSAKLRALLRGEKLPIDTPPHKYKQETTCGIGFCEICYSDDANDGNHLENDEPQTETSKDSAERM